MATSFSGDKPHYTLGGIVRRSGGVVPVSVSGREVARMSAGQPRSPARPHGSLAREPHGLLPPWAAVLAVVAHPDDESFGLGAIIDRMTSGGAAVHVLCYTRGEASTLNQTGADLTRQRARELRQAGAALGVSTVALLDYPDGRLAAGAGRRAGRARHRAGRPVSPRRAAGLRRHRHHRPSRPPGRHAGGRPRRRPAEPARAGLGAARRHRRPPARPRQASRSPARRPGGWTSPSGSAGPGSARPRCCMPARSRPQRRSGGGWSCRETSSTCAGSCRRRPARPERC